MPTPPGSARRFRSRALVLSAAREHDAVTRAELETLTGLSRSAVADAVSDLLAQGLLGERAPGRGSGRGRPSALLAPRRPPGLVLGIDFGHAHVAAALADTSGAVLAEERRTADVDDRADTALAVATRLVRQLLRATGHRAADVLAAAAGIPGPLDSETKQVRSPTILAGWVDVEPERELARRLGFPVSASNDADLGALGEGRYGAARGLRDYIYVKASHGIGAGLVLGGEVYRGAGGLAGEIGHTQIGELGGWCRCGNRGCLETVLSIPQIRARLDELDAGPTDPIAARIIIEAGRTIGRVVADLCNCLNPAAVVIGGELVAHGDALAAGVRESIDRFAQPATSRMVQVRVAELGLRSELLGAIGLAIRAVETPGAAPGSDRGRSRRSDG